LQKELRLWRIPQLCLEPKLRHFRRQIRLKNDGKGSRRDVLRIAVVLLLRKGKILYKMLQLRLRSVERRLVERAHSGAVAYVIILDTILVHARDVSNLL